MVTKVKFNKIAVGEFFRLYKERTIYRKVDNKYAVSVEHGTKARFGKQCLFVKCAYGERKSILGVVPSINIEEVPDEFSDEIWAKLDINGGNVIYVDGDSDFGKWLKTQGYELRSGNWGWLVVFR